MIWKLYWDICELMNNFRYKTLAWKEMALEIIDLSKSELSLDDFKKHCLLQEKTIEKSYDDRMDILNYFLNNGIILLREKKLYLGKLPKDGEFFNLLVSGDKNAWQIATATFSESTIENIFDDAYLKEIGEIGEKFVLDELRNIIPDKFHKEIDQVSQRDDRLGFDILTPSILDYDKKILLEVKTTTKPYEDFRFYISSNEYHVSQKRSEIWYLVFVRITNDIPELIGHMSGGILSDKMPDNCNDRVSWQSSKVVAHAGWIKDGLP